MGAKAGRVPCFLALNLMSQPWGSAVVLVTLQRKGFSTCSFSAPFLNTLQTCKTKANRISQVCFSQTQPFSQSCYVLKACCSCLVLVMGERCPWSMRTQRSPSAKCRRWGLLQIPTNKLSAVTGLKESLIRKFNPLGVFKVLQVLHHLLPQHFRKQFIS